MIKWVVNDYCLAFFPCSVDEMGVKKIINLLIFRAVFSKVIYMMLLFEVLFDYFKNILELTIENRVKKYTWTCVGTDQGFPGHSSGKPNKPNFLVYPPRGGGGTLGISGWGCAAGTLELLTHSLLEILPKNAFWS